MANLADVAFLDAYARSAVQGIERDLKRHLCLRLDERSIKALLIGVEGILRLAEVHEIPGCAVDPNLDDCD